MNLTIGSGDATKLLSGKNTKGFSELLQKFVSDDKPYYNAFASPIDALRTGAILETKYIYTLDEAYYFQYKSTCKEFDCLTSSIDFVKMVNGDIIDFDELKTIFLTEYIEHIIPLMELSEEEQNNYLKKKFKNNYNQVQFQLLCTGLESANLVFLSVESYNDDENYTREINVNDFLKFRINMDNEVISKIKERVLFFQEIKDYFSK